MKVRTLRDTVTMHDTDLPEGAVLDAVTVWGTAYYRGTYRNVAELVRREDCRELDKEKPE